MSKKKNRKKEKQNVVNTNVPDGGTTPVRRPFAEEVREASTLRKYGTIVGAFLLSFVFGFLLSSVSLPFSGRNTDNATAVSLYALSAPISTVSAQSVAVSSHVYFFGMEDCQFCKAEKKFLSGYLPSHKEVTLEYYDIVKDPKAKELFNAITSVNGLPHVTPLTLVGGKVIQGYGGDETTGKEILAGIELAKNGKDVPISFYDKKGDAVKGASGCDADAKECGIVGPGNTNLVFNVPFLGPTDLKDLSLFTLSAVLGFIDGFNPCALWVLITFLLALIQIGSRKKMLYVAGLFLLAEAIMYYAILTAWYKTWDFVGLDQIVTPMVGLLSLGSGIFFLYRWKKAKDTVTCDITDIEHQEKISGKIYQLANAPLTIATALGIIGIALSVNIIEFACSIGIPQVFTKTLELNQPPFWQYQGYMAIYMLGYMADDIVVFGFALYGINKIHESEKYSKYSLLIGGLLMLLLGALLTFVPNMLVL
ncbi:MAG: glutaredoxin [Candidatus Parcubacteria bacterium]|nr:glutaredoxin [Candidatus Parcubacteria bacterium]